MAHWRNQPMTPTLYITQQSVISYINDHVIPRIKKWEREMKEVREKIKKKIKKKQAEKLFNMISVIADGVTTLQKSGGYRFYDIQGRFLDELAPTVPEDMEKKLAVWQQQAQTIKTPDHLEQLLNIFQSQLQSWTEKLTKVFSESQQTQRQVDSPKHKNNDRQQPTEIPKGGTSGSTQTTQDEGNTILHEKLQKEVSDLRMRYDSKVAETMQMNKDEENLKAEIEQLRKESGEQRKQVKAKEGENNELLNRLSAVAGYKPQENNPAFNDLSSEIRPTKIAEKFKELYDKQRKDALTELMNQGFPEISAIQILMTTIEESFQFTAVMAKMRLQTLEACALSLPFHNERKAENGWQVDKSKTMSEGSEKNDRNQDRDKGQKHVEQAALSDEFKDLVKQLRKASATTKTHVEEIQNRFVELQRTNNLPPKKEEKMIAFCEGCAKVTWYMNLQTPPLSLAPKPARGTPLVTDLYMPYTASGPTVDYVVWPACLLHEMGPVLEKGVVQPFQKHK